MRAWGIRTFDNEDALDWLASLDDASDDSVLREALDEVAEAGPADYVESPWGACALAAAEVVAAARGRPSSVLPEEALRWAEANTAAVTDGHRALALRAVERVAAGGSELRELWLESVDAGAWRAQVDDLLRRLA